MTHILKSLQATFSPEAYNQLSDVETANEALDIAASRVACFSRIHEYVCTESIWPLIGLCLLHRHNDLPINSRMIEKHEVEGRPREALVMRLISSPSVQHVPVSWQIVPRGDALQLRPVEFTEDASTIERHDRLLRSPHHLVELARIIGETGMEGLLGLAVLRHDLLTVDEGWDLVERVDVNDIANVLAAERLSDLDKASLIQTVWAFRPDVDITMACTNSCVPGHRCVARSPGHSRESSHASVHSIPAFTETEE